MSNRLNLFTDWVGLTPILCDWHRTGNASAWSGSFDVQGGGLPKPARSRHGCKEHIHGWHGRYHGYLAINPTRFWSTRTLDSSYNTERWAYCCSCLWYWAYHYFWKSRHTALFDEWFESTYHWLIWLSWIWRFCRPDTSHSNLNFKITKCYTHDPSHNWVNMWKCSFLNACTAIVVCCHGHDQIWIRSRAVPQLVCSYWTYFELVNVPFGPMKFSNIWYTLCMYIAPKIIYISSMQCEHKMNVTTDAIWYWDQYKS